VREREREREVTPPFAKAMAMIAAASITQDRGFHIKPRNFRNLFSCFRIFFFIDQLIYLKTNYKLKKIDKKVYEYCLLFF
jgi:hypothetical protein